MLEDFKGRSSKITYFIYGYFNEKVDFPLNDASKFKSVVLAYTKGKNDNKVSKNVADDLGVSQSELADFLGCLKFQYTKKYDPHKEAAISDLRQVKNCSIEEAKGLYYPNAFALVADLASKPTLAERVISKAEFLSKIDSSQIIFHHLLLREKEESTYCKMIRRSVFTQTNISPYARFFSFECSGTEPLHELKELVSLVGKKWSCSRKGRLEPQFRFAPYVLLRNCPSAKLAKLKAELYNESYTFIDGFPFNGADFTPSHIHSDQTNEHRISVRILSDEAELKTALDTMTTKTKELYNFFQTTQLPIDANIKHVSIPIASLSMIPRII